MGKEGVSFDFEEWAALGRLDFIEFERRRREVVMRLILAASDTRRAEGLQCRIDLERRRGRTAMKATIRISSMMWNSFYEFRDRINRIGSGAPARRSNNAVAIKPSIANIFSLSAKRCSSSAMPCSDDLAQHIAADHTVDTGSPQVAN